jgi:hypothetical protein
LKEIEAGQRPESDRRLALTALGLGRLMTVALLGFLLGLLILVSR